MANLPSSAQTLNPFGKILSLLTLLAAALYFTGWSYRWAYYSVFYLEVTVLDLPFESFYLAAFQALLGCPFTILKTVVALLIALVAIFVTLQLRRKMVRSFQRSRFRFFSNHTSMTEAVRFAVSLVDEFIVLLVILTILFWLARWQGKTDAWKDAVNETSSLPAVTIVIPAEGVAVGKEVDTPTLNPSFPKIRIIGDLELYRNKVLKYGLNDTRNIDKQRVWRLLLDRNGYFYVFPALPSKTRFLDFPVLIVYESSAQLVILSPSSTPYK